MSFSQQISESSWSPDGDTGMWEVPTGQCGRDGRPELGRTEGVSGDGHRGCHRAAVGGHG